MGEGRWEEYCAIDGCEWNALQCTFCISSARVVRRDGHRYVDDKASRYSQMKPLDSRGLGDVPRTETELTWSKNRLRSDLAFWLTFRSQVAPSQLREATPAMFKAFSTPTFPTPHFDF